MDFLTQNPFGRIIGDYVGVLFIWSVFGVYLIFFGNPMIGIAAPGLIVAAANYYIHGTSVVMSAINAAIAWAIYMYGFPGRMRGLKWF